MPVVSPHCWELGTRTTRHSVAGSDFDAVQLGVLVPMAEQEPQ